MSEHVSPSETTPGPQTDNGKKKNLWIWVLIVAVLIGGVFAFAFQHLGKERTSMEYDLAQRQRIIASTRADAVDVWLQSVVEKTKRLVSSDIFQLFASEVDKIPGGIPLLFSQANAEDGSDANGDQLSSRLPFMRTILMDFVSDNGFLSARIVNTKAEPYMTTEATMEPLNTTQQTLVQRVLETGDIAYSPLETSGRGMLLTLFIPILPPQHERESNRPVAVMLLTHIAGAKLSEVLQPGAFDGKGQTLRLVQKNGDTYNEVNFEATALRLAREFTLTPQNELAFGERSSLVGKGPVYSSGIKVRPLDWWIVAENSSVDLERVMEDKAKTVYLLSALFALVLVLLVVAVWWRLIGREQSAINEKFRSLLAVIEDQKQLLDGINSTISDPISLTDVKGHFAYVNVAFAKVVGRTEDDVVGLDGPAVFGFDTAKRLSVPDQHVIMTGESVSVNEVLWLQSKRYYFQISKTPLLDPATRAPQGIVSVYRDITQLVEAEQHSRRVVQQTINALVRTIEEADPFLGGHSRIMGGIASLVAKQLGLSGPDIATIEAAANLSQIGKMFVPREILLKPGSLSPDEKKEMEKHIDHACNVLKDIEFDLPVVAAIRQMNERLDGQGYPQGLSGDQISVHARVLAVANAFAAMARPRSYRPALPVTQVVDILQKETGNYYDTQIVDALRAVIATPAGEKLVEQAAQSKAV